MTNTLREIFGEYFYNKEHLQNRKVKVEMCEELIRDYHRELQKEIEEAGLIVVGDLSDDYSTTRKFTGYIDAGTGTVLIEHNDSVILKITDLSE